MATMAIAIRTMVMTRGTITMPVRNIAINMNTIMANLRADVPGRVK